MRYDAPASWTDEDPPSNNIMSLRDKLNGNPLAAGGIALGVVVLAVLVLAYWYWPQNTQGSGLVWAYDVQAGRLYATPALTGTVGDVGQDVYEAEVYTCSTCDAERNVAYLIQYDQTARAAILQRQKGIEEVNGEPISEIINRGRMVRRLEDPNFMPASSPQGFALIERAVSMCGENEPTRQCFPNAE